MEPITSDRKLKALLARRLATIEFVREQLRRAYDALDEGRGDMVHINALRAHLAALGVDLETEPIEGVVVDVSPSGPAPRSPRALTASPLGTVELS